MRTLAISALGAVVALSVLVPTVKAAPPAKGGALDLPALKKRASKAVRAGSEIPALLPMVQRMQRQLNAIDGRLRAQETKDVGYLALRAMVDGFVRQLEELELRIAAVAIQAGDQAKVGYEGGFYLRANRALELRIRGLMVLAYEGRIVDEQRRALPAQSGANASTFTLPRARLTLSGRLFDERLTFLLRLANGERDVRSGVLDAYGTLAFHQLLGLQVGLMRVPFGRQYAGELEATLFGDRSPTTDNFYPGRDLGATIGGKLVGGGIPGVLSYRLGIFNGSGVQTSDDNTDFLYAGRLVYQPLGELPSGETPTRRDSRFLVGLGGSFFFNLAPTDQATRLGETDPAAVEVLRDQDRDGDVDNVAILSLAAELVLVWHGVSVQGELFFRQEDPGAVGKARTYWGGYGQVGALLFSGLDAAVRYGRWDVQRYGDDGTLFAAAEIREIAGALNGWFFSRRLRLQTAYRYRWYREIGDLEGGQPAETQQGAHELTVLAQLAF